MNEVTSRFEETEHLLLSWEGTAMVQTSAGPREAPCSLEAVMELVGDHPTRRGVGLVRLGIAVGGVDGREGPTGTITVTGRKGRGIATPQKRGLSIHLEVESDLNYESLDSARGVRTDVACYYVPATEPCVAVLEGVLGAGKRGIGLSRGTLRVACAAGGFEEVHALEIDLGNLELAEIAPPRPHYRLGERGEWAPLDDANTDANICIQTNRRRMVIQPVGFRDSATDANPSGSTAAAQLGTAQAVWGKACINFQVNSIHLITDATLKTSSDLTAIRNSFTDSSPNVIEMFFVANSLPAIGGGQAGGIGVASCKPVIAEPNGGNPVLVAHELGHVLGLFHPGTGSNSDAGTVMAPTGSAMNPGTNTVTHFMCVSIANPVLTTLTETCCLTHDIGNHYLRDFPVDVGSEPSEPLPAGMNRYAMSNVWNRLTNTPGGWNASTGPEHQQPVRFNADMTARTNFLFAKVEQTVNLKVRNAVVKFFRKNPGSGGGASNLFFIGEVPVPDALAVGVPQTVSLPWTIPSGTPNHSCVFAVVRSDAEQEGDQSGLDWWQFEALSRQDNDWAQRNLAIEDFASGNEGDSNAVESAPVLIHLPPPRERKGDLLLEIDARAAGAAEELSLEVVGEQTHTLKPGGQSKIDVSLTRRREPVALVIRARIPGGLDRGSLLSVDVNPSVGGRPLVGFACAFRAARARDAIAQTLDVAAGALIDIAEVVELEAAGEALCELRELLACPSYALGRFAAQLARLRNPLSADRSALGRLRSARRTGVVDALDRWLESLDAEAPAQEVVEAFRSFSNRLAVAAAMELEDGVG